ncbi:MAG TPA: hypothetical protein VMD30_12375 [Tepidisphaeraceae bacterium]|nr:hypothetical protein [Tepidisphaeraceae bacterium]
MWGNRLGWILAVLSVAVICGLIAILLEMEQPTPPTALTADASNLDVIALPISPQDAWPLPDADNRDAGDLYRKVIDSWDDRQEQACRNFASSPLGQPPQPLALLLQSTDCADMRLFQDDPEAVVNYDNAHPPLDALTDAGEAALDVGLSLGKRHDAARGLQYIEAGFNLGRNLYDERIVYAEFQDGLQLMADATAAVRLIEPGSDLAQRLTQFDAGRLDYVTNHVEPIWRAIDSADAGVIAANAGDVFVFAARSREAMWRVEAVLKLGRFRFDVNRYGDEALANRMIGRYETDPNPAVAAAAREAKNLTIEKYRQLGGPG